MVYTSKYENNSAYSKHYYIGSERVASAIGTGDFNGNSDPQTGPHAESLTEHPLWDVLRDYLDALSIEIDEYDGYVSSEGEPLHSTYESCIEMWGGDQDEVDNCLCLYFPSYAQSQSIHCEDYAPIYWYHPDYLGNTEFVSDRMGRPYQHFYYSPFGEELVEQEPYNADYYSPYHFNAKEVDSETGYHYYGARYYNSNLSVWLSVDPKYFKARGLTPYRFGFNNPVVYSDPTGKFEDKASAKEYAKDNGIKTGFFRRHKIEKHSDGSFAILDKRSQYFIQNDSEFGIVIGVHVEGVRTKYELPESQAHTNEISGTLTMGGGISFSFGYGRDSNDKLFFTKSYGPAFGVDASLGVSRTNYYTYDQKDLSYTDLRGDGAEIELGITIIDAVSGGDMKSGKGPFGESRNPKVNSYYSESLGVSFGLPVGFSYRAFETKTWR